LKIAYIVKRVGPYHRARLQAAAARADVRAVQLFAFERTYEWSTEDLSQLRVTTLSEHESSLSVRDLNRILIEALQASDPEVVCIPGYAEPTSLAALDWCKARGRGAVLLSESQAQDAPRIAITEFVKRQIVRAYDAALVGGTTHRAYARALGLEDGRIFEGYDVVDNDYYAIASANARRERETRVLLGLPERYIFACSRFVEKKNLPGLLRAYRLYTKRTADPWPLVIAGDGPLRPVIERAIDDLGLKNLVQLRGFVQYKELPAFFGCAGFFVHAATTEQWGLVVNEAMACSLPVVVSERCGCAPDLVRRGENGFAFQPDDEDGLAKILYTLSSDASLRSKMSQRSRDVINGWSLNRFVESLLAACSMARNSRRTTLVGWTAIRATRVASGWRAAL